MADQPEFGQPVPGRTYRERPSAYGIVFGGEGRVLVVEEDDEYYLPGGGLDPGEDNDTGVRREFVEETGYTIEILGALGTARQYAIDKKSGQAWMKLCAFYAVRLVGESKGPGIASNRPEWVTVAEAMALLNDDAQRWGLRQALARRGS